MKYFSDFKRNTILTHATTWMKLENIKLSKISQIQRTNIVILFILSYLESSDS